jgi:hypothetical protein
MKGAWLVLLAIAALICMIYPPFLGVILGTCMWVIPIALLCYLLGHKGPIIQ